jgi:dTDP-4-dehydrorhamnose reductase
LIGWFLAQKEKVKGYRKAIFSGFPTVEIARIIGDYVIPHSELHGVYHVSADPVNKYDLLSMVAAVYQKNIEIVPDDWHIIDRSLNSTRFREATGFSSESWHELVRRMHAFG